MSKFSTPKSMKSAVAPLINDQDQGMDANVRSPLLHMDDPLLKQLPRELHEFVQTPQQDQAKIEYVKTGDESMLHSVGVAVGTLFCCYSLCRQHLIKRGQLGLTQNAEKPEVLGPGRHFLLNPFNEFVAVESVTKPVITHGPLHIIRVEMGQLGYGMNMKTGQPVILARGKHIINDNYFIWRRFITLQDRITQLDQLQIIRIETGYVGYAFRGGKLVILKPGLHLIEPPDRFGDIISTMNQIIELAEAIHETSDYVPVSIKASIFFRIVNAEKALLTISDIRKQITETAVATLAGIIRASSLSDIASRSQVGYHKGQGKDLTAKENASIVQSDQAQRSMPSSSRNVTIPPSSAEDEPSAPPFFQHVHDQFIQELHDHVLDEWGIEIQNIRIESLKISDPQLQKSISNQAIDVSKQHNKYLMLQKKQEIIIVEANAAAEKNKIETEAEATRIRSAAQAAADAVVIQAKADKEANVLKGQGQAEFARLLESTALGKDISVMQIQADTLKGLEQVAYVPHLPGMLGASGIFGNKTFDSEK